jgi:hypothetical protein
LNVLVIGAKGNMGRRYCAILRHLGHEPLEIDVPWPAKLPQDWTHAIVATPTDTHWDAICELTDALTSLEPRRYVLCEKPVATSLRELNAIRMEVQSANIQLNCVNQYNYLPEVTNIATDEGNPSWYYYYNHGKDGLHWDCFQIYALATDLVDLNESSPIWDCGINGMKVSIAGMDWAYIDMIEDWLGPQKHVWGWDVIERTTRRILEAI